MLELTTEQIYINKKLQKLFEDIEFLCQAVSNIRKRQESQHMSIIQLKQNQSIFKMKERIFFISLTVAAVSAGTLLMLIILSK